MSESSPKTYEPKAVEEKLYSKWEAAGCFKGNPQNPNEPFTIVIPPPNVTGILHMGHALDNTLQDILVRYHRMNGKATLWVPGTDHAGIATQNVVEKQLLKEGLNRQDLGREKFLEKVWAWKETSGGQIIHQLKRLGASCDWSRERFTMDEGLSKAVRHVFVTLYKEGLIYKSNYLVSWCPRCQTALSDLEVEYEEKDGQLTYFKYVIDATSTITVATTRPETLLGDTAVAVHPEDARYQNLIGKTFTHPLTKNTLVVIADESVDREFGTGAVKITPAHDPNDYDMGKRHHLPMPNILDELGRIEFKTSEFHGLDRFVARKKIIEKLKELNLFVKAEPHKHAVGHCQRCHTVVEPRLSDQWFVKIKPLAEPAIAAVTSNQTRFVPENWTKTYLQWMENIKDWCISRQLWWGHRIPVWYCGECKHQTVALTDPTECESCHSKKIVQDPDVLDTWFSSGLWPFSTLGWPEKTADLQKFYPTSVLVTGFDIIFFWVARMMMMGMKFMGDVPFRVVHIHALVRDEHGKKMSKSKGNVIDPLEVMDTYGTDAFRFALASFSIQGRDILLSVKRIEGYRNFISKIWNASRLLLQLKETAPKNTTLSIADAWIEMKLRTATAEVRASIEAMKFNEAADTLYKFVWHEFCDWYLEALKVNPNMDHAMSVFERTLRLLHPFCPFITEELWGAFTGAKEDEFLMLAKYPEVQEVSTSAAISEFEVIKTTVESIRNFRSENKIAPAKPITARVHTKSLEYNQLLIKYAGYLKSLAGVHTILPHDDATDLGKVSKLPCGAYPFDIEVSWQGLIDKQAEKDRLQKLLLQAQEDVRFLVDRLGSATYRDKAPPQLIAKDEEKLAKAKTLVDKYQHELNAL